MPIPMLPVTPFVAFVPFVVGFCEALHPLPRLPRDQPAVSLSGR